MVKSAEQYHAFFLPVSVSGKNIKSFMLCCKCSSNRNSGRFLAQRFPACLCQHADFHFFFFLFHVGAIRVTDSPHQDAKKDNRERQFYGLPFGPVAASMY